MGAIGGPGKGGVVLSKVFSGKQLWTVGKSDVVFGEAFRSCRRRGHNNDRAGAKLEVCDGAIFVGQFGKCSVEGFLEEVEMAYDGEGESRAWWESFAKFLQIVLEEKKDDEEQNVIVE